MDSATAASSGRACGADLNVIDHDALTLYSPRMAHDLPAGGRRLLQAADGYDFTVVAGEITRENGIDTGARPGRLIRGSAVVLDERAGPGWRMGSR